MEFMKLFHRIPLLSGENTENIKKNPGPCRRNLHKKRFRTITDMTMWKSRRHFVLRLLLPVLLFCTAKLDGAPAEINRQFIEAARTTKPSVVNIIIYKTSTVQGRTRYTKAAFGSGTIITGDGYLVTNYHVVKKGTFHQIILNDGQEYEARPFRNGKHYLADEKTDLALMKIDGDPGRFTPMEFGDSDALADGEWVIAIGNPYGLRQSITSGIVSYRGRSNIGFADIEDFIQTDVPINPGNSGGPLINLQGKLVGINTAIRTVSGGYQGISFAIPSNLVKTIAWDLIRNGRVRRGWIGFIAQERKIHKRGERSIIEVISVVKNSPAETAGIKKNDIIRSINGKKITSLGELVSSISKKPVGSKLRITASREGELRDFTLLLREKQFYRRMQRQISSLFARYGIELDENAHTGEVIISYLSPIRKGFQYGLKRGDIVAALNGNRIGSLDDFIRVFDRAQSEISDIDISRNGNHITIEFFDNLE